MEGTGEKGILAQSATRPALNFKLPEPCFLFFFFPPTIWNKAPQMKGFALWPFSGVPQDRQWKSLDDALGLHPFYIKRISKSSGIGIGIGTRLGNQGVRWHIATSSNMKKKNATKHFFDLNSYAFPYQHTEPGVQVWLSPHFWNLSYQKWVKAPKISPCDVFLQKHHPCFPFPA